MLPIWSIIASEEEKNNNIQLRVRQEYCSKLQMKSQDNRLALSFSKQISRWARGTDGITWDRLHLYYLVIKDIKHVPNMQQSAYFDEWCNQRNDHFHTHIWWKASKLAPPSTWDS